MPRRPSKIRAPKVPARAVTVKVDPKLKSLWEQTLSTIEHAMARGADAFDELWEAAGRAVTHEPPLYAFGGYKSPADFFREVLHEEPRTAQRYMRVAKFATPKEEDAFGVQKLDAALGYVEAKTGHAVDGALPVAFERLRIPVQNGKSARALPLAEATVAQVNAATRALRGGRTKGGPKSAVREAMQSALGDDEALAGIAVHEANGFVSFTRVPVGQLERFATAVRKGRVAFEKRGTRR